MKRFPIAREPLSWTFPKVGLIHLYPEGSGWACDINGGRAWTFMIPNRNEVERSVRDQLQAWSYIETFRHVVAARPLGPSAPSEIQLSPFEVAILETQLKDEKDPTL